MIKANELRIGNWVNINYHSGYELEQLTSVDDGNYEYLHPIPLTPEILEKCGFIRTDDVFKLGNLIIYKYNHEYTCWFTQVTNISTIDLRVKFEYLHQLQNLYFALTGEELSVNL